MDVTRDDQQKINQFSKLYLQYKDMKKELQRYSELIESVDDAQSELELNDDSDPSM